MSLWNIRKRILKGDYYYTYLPEHPNCTSNGYVLEHRAIFENNLNRMLSDDEVVHHKNKNKKDNSFDNLELTTKEDHAKIHGKERLRNIVTLKCPWCGIIFDRYENKTFLVKGGIYTACSRSCNGKISAKLGDSDVNDRVKENVIKKYYGKLDFS